MNQSPQQQQQPGAPVNTGMLADIVRQIRLVWKLLWDPRVPLWIKLIPTTAMIYVISPIDFIPELAVPGIGLLDDLGVLTLGLATFVNLCPPDVVQEHMQAIRGETNWRVVPPDQADNTAPPSAPKVIDAPYTVKPDDSKDSTP